MATKLKLGLVGCLCLAISTAAGASAFDDNILYRPSTSQWFLSHNPGGPDYYPPSAGGGASITSSASWGLVGDAPLVGDVNGDGFDDIVALHPGADNLWYWLAGHTVDTNADHAGEIGSQSFPSADSSLNAWGIAGGSVGNYLADMNGDGYDDVVTINPGHNWVTTPSGPGGLGDGVVTSHVQFGLSEDQPIVGDFNGDGMKDVGVFRWSGGEIITTFTGAGGVLGAGGIGPIGQIGGGNSNDRLFVANLDGDAFDDAIMIRGDADGGLLEWFGLINDGTGYLNFFNAGTTIASFGFDDGLDEPFIADINGDGLDDIGITRGGSYHYAAFTGPGGVLGSAVDEEWLFGLAGDIQLFGDFNVVPEPATLMLLGLGCVLLRRRP